MEAYGARYFLLEISALDRDRGYLEVCAEQKFVAAHKCASWKTTVEICVMVARVSLLPPANVGNGFASQ